LRREGTFLVNHNFNVYMDSTASKRLFAGDDLVFPETASLSTCTRSRPASIYSGATSIPRT
jgi:hypothetical protein